MRQGRCPPPPNSNRQGFHGTQYGSYPYAGDGLRLSASTGSQAAKTTKFLWDQSFGLPQLAIERNGNDALLRDYTYALDPLSAQPAGRQQDLPLPPRRAGLGDRRHRQHRVLGLVERPLPVRLVHVGQNPVLFTDPSGRCFGPLIFLAPACIPLERLLVSAYPRSTEGPE